MDKKICYDKTIEKLLLTKIKCNGQFSFHSASERIFIYYLYGYFCFCQRAEKFKNLFIVGDGMWFYCRSINCISDV